MAAGSIIPITLFENNAYSESPTPTKPVSIDVVSVESGEDDEKAVVRYEADPRVYDSGRLLTVLYQRNKNNLESVENQILDCEDSFEKVDKIWDVLHEVLPTISHFYSTVTRITLETVEGKLATAVTEDVDEIIPYVAIPSHLSHVSTVPITTLERIQEVYMDVDRVQWRGNTYAFKRTGEDLDGTLRELDILDRLDNSPHVIKLEAIEDNTIRGFLTPFMHAGDLENVFRMACKNLGLSADADATAFDWPLKLSWACQITHAVVDLHAISAYNGDLKPQNVLIGLVGQAILVDFLPKGFSDGFAAPELKMLAKHRNHETSFESVLTAPADVYSLGLVLWAVAEEKWKGMYLPLWRGGSTPGWYRDIVERYIDVDPLSKPSSVEVLSLLETEGPPISSL